ncbi:MAG: RdgB/HAM1 family non-canonical purine NTP pyrophosphatase [Acidobacteriia bacterium]|nr:RdgB/HAM1 family non-canonical purine NTP pyrophosphatase [Terriglobia bacterium]
MTLYCATSNAGKLREFRLAGQRFGIDVMEMPGLQEIPPCDETGRTFKANAILKATYYGQQAPGLLFADDSGLEVDTLGGAPGVVSARYAGPGASDAQNNALLLGNMRGRENRRARFVCVIALANRGEMIRTFRGIVEGEILDEARGAEGFGYDPLFYYAPYQKSFGEASVEEKMAVSHRGRALTAMFRYLSDSPQRHKAAK